jgi:Beta-lactamase superfamily domain
VSGLFDVTFIGHACLKITVGRLKILTDPWLNGPAYTRQWYQYPLPDRSVPIDDVHYIHYSHGHEDHLHAPTFSLLPKSATVLLTRQWFPGNAEWLKSEGFFTVREVPSGQWIRLADPSQSDAVDCVNLVNRSDSISILMSSRETLVNVNDALHCYDTSCIDHYCRRIHGLLKGRPIDFLFCGYAGASYFPNCLRHPNKDDREVAIARERHLAQGFARLVQNLAPRTALAFASGAVLLEPFNIWINEVKFRNDPILLTEQQLPSMRGRMFNLVPGDRITSRGLERSCPVLTTEDHVAEYKRIYAQQINAKKVPPVLSRAAADRILKHVESNVRRRVSNLRTDKISFDWAIRLRDCPEAILRLTRQKGLLETAMLPAESLETVRDMVVEANSEILAAGVESRWGGDSLHIGCGGIFHLRSDGSVRDNHSRLFLRLATQLPTQSEYLRLSPMRAIDHLIRSPFLIREAFRIAVSKADRRSLDSSACRSGKMDASRWIDADNCAGCPVCDVAEPRRE